MIPVAGFCSRWGHRPKCLYEYGGQPIIVRAIERLKHLGKIIVIVGHKKSLITPVLPDYVDVVENRFYLSQNVCGSVLCATKKITSDKVLVVMGDTVFNEIKFSADSLSKLSVDRYNVANDDCVGVDVNDAGYVETMGYQFDKKWQQFVYLTGTELDLFFEFCKKNHEKFAFEAINYAIANGGIFKVIKDSPRIVEIDNKQDTKKLCLLTPNEY